MQITQIFKTAKISTSSLSYQQTCIEACTTTAGAYSLADRLEAEEKAAMLGGARRNQYRHQKEAASLAAGYARLTNDLDERIPTALQAAEGLSRKNLKLAQDALKAAEQEAVARQEKLDAYVVQRDKVRLASEQAISVAKVNLDEAKRLLNSARESEDLAAVESAAVGLHKMSQSFENAKASQEPQAIHLQAISEMAAKAKTEYDAAIAAVEACQKALQRAEVRIAEVACDKAMLTALKACLDWYRVTAALGRSALPYDVRNDSFRFHDAEHAPCWREGHAPTLCVPIRDFDRACIGPDWQVFKTDPATIPEAAQEKPNEEPGWLNRMNTEISAKNAELAAASAADPNGPKPSVTMQADARG